jgi:penicillin amidase
MQRAGTVEAFVRATAGWMAPMQNMVVADREGRIGVARRPCAAAQVPTTT